MRRTSELSASLGLGALHSVGLADTLRNLADRIDDRQEHHGWSLSNMKVTRDTEAFTLRLEFDTYLDDREYALAQSHIQIQDGLAVVQERVNAAVDWEFRQAHERGEAADLDIEALVRRHFDAALRLDGP